MAGLPTELEEPAHVRAAPAHDDPYPYYARLARGEGMFRDDENGWWVAASAAAVRDVLTSELCRTRPAAERVPLALQGGAMAELFGRLVRLRDDEGHVALKAAIHAALRAQDAAMVASLTRAHARALDRELAEPVDETGITRFAFALPLRVLAQLVGIPTERLGDVETWLREYGAATAGVVTGVPTPDAALLERGHRAARNLLDLARAVYDEPSARGPLAAAFAAEARSLGCAEEDVVANAVGLLTQGYAATASLIGLTLLSLSRHPELRAEVAAAPPLLRAVVQEVLRSDPSTSSTIRWVARDGVVAGRALRAGEMIIVAIAAANRDPALNPDPDRFDVHRQSRRYLEFGAGAHACPADRLAPLIAETAVAHLLRRNVAVDGLADAVSYLASAHIRTPVFGAPAPG